MAIYYVDPYINATVGGIQGTNVPSARTGTWSDPFSALDLLNSSSSITSINGVTINNGDEIRFKGLSSIDDFVYGTIQTTYSSFNSRPIISGDQTTFSNWKTSLNTNLGSYRGAFFVSDTNHTWLYENIASTDIPKGLVISQTSNDTSTTNIIGYGSSAYNMAPIYEACKNALYLKLIKPTHIIKQTTTASNFLNINANVTYSAGWTSEATQDGQTIFAMMQNGNGANIFGINSTTRTIKMDLERFHFFRGNYAGDYTQNSTWDFRGLQGSYTHRIGTISSINVNAWSYFYFRDMTAKSNISLKIGVYCDYYCQHQTNANGSYTNNSVIIATYHGGLGHYRLGDFGTSVTLGNMFLYNQYTGSSMMYFGSSTTDTNIKFLDKSYVYAHSGMPLVVSNYSGTVTFLGSIYNYESTQFQTAMTGAAGSGPVVGGVKFPLGLNSNQLAKTPLNPANWYERLMYSAFGSGSDTTYIYAYSFGQINSNMGILETNGVDYKSSNSNIPIRVQGYSSQSTWGGDYNYTFESNTYDKKVISTTGIDTTSPGTMYVPLICYNDTNNNLVIQCNTNSTIAYHSKRVSLGYLDITGKTTINVSLQISKNINFASAGVSAFLTYKNTSGNENNVTLSSTYDSGTMTWTLSASVLTSAVISTSSHFGLIIRVLNTSGGYSNTYTVKNIQYTLT